MRLRPVCLEKIWADPSLDHPLAARLAPPAMTGEIWLAADRHHPTPVAEGWGRGSGLDEMAAAHGGEIMGPGHDGPLPLITKLLAVGDWLSVQVHPDDATARRLEGEPWGKSEAWLVLDAAPGAEIVMGLAPGAGREEVARSMAAGRMAEVLAKVPAAGGDLFHLPAGTLHAIGPGLTIFEVQQASDVTYRFYDWDRPGLDGRMRELHIDKALAALTPAGPGAPAPAREESPGVKVLVEEPAFALLEVRTKQTYRPIYGGRRLRFMLVTDGSGRLNAADQSFNLAPGQSWCLPWALEEAVVVPGGEGIALLESVAPAP